MAAPLQPVTELTMSLHLSRQASEKLAERAARSGRDISDVASELIEQAVETAIVDVPYDRWRADYEAWVASHKPVGHVVDDSRESIYAGRGQ